MNPYLTLLNWLHWPFVGRARDDPYHARFPEFMKLVAAMPSPVIDSVRATSAVC